MHSFIFVGNDCVCLGQNHCKKLNHFYQGFLLVIQAKCIILHKKVSFILSSDLFILNSTFFNEY